MSDTFPAEEIPWLRAKAPVPGEGVDLLHAGDTYSTLGLCRHFTRIAGPREDC